MRQPKILKTIHLGFILQMIIKINPNQKYLLSREDKVEIKVQSSLQKGRLRQTNKKAKRKQISIKKILHHLSYNLSKVPLQNKVKDIRNYSRKEIIKKLKSKKKRKIKEKKK